jgi:hypothetical protein
VQRLLAPAEELKDPADSDNMPRISSHRLPNLLDVIGFEKQHVHLVYLVVK